MTYADAEARLLALPRFTADGSVALQPGFARVEALLAALGDPHRAVPCLHVAGTNGKGSTASTAAALLTRLGHRTGLHTSPHLWHLAERFRLDGVPAPEAWIADAVARLAPAIDAARPSYFEATTALAFAYVAEAGATASVVEVGLGGRLDATNVVTPRACLVTALGLDHTDVLGPTLADVAREKAGIFKPGVPAFTVEQPPEALDVLHAEAARVGAPLTVVAPALASEGGDLVVQTRRARYDGLRLALGGTPQRANAALAVAGVEAFEDAPLPRDAVRDALARVPELAGLRARLETVHDAPRVVLDVAHNPDGLAAALAATRPSEGGRRVVLFGTMADKDVDALVALLARSDAEVWPVPLPGVPRALPADALAARLRASGVPVGEPAAVPEGVDRFLAAATSADVLLVTGSFLVAAGYPEARLPARTL